MKNEEKKEESFLFGISFINFLWLSAGFGAIIGLIVGANVLIRF